MDKRGYWIAHFEVTDLEAYRAYQAKVVAILRGYEPVAQSPIGT
jgi:uncharacterized protein (DUF1330 family)